MAVRPFNEGVADCGRASRGRYASGCRCDACRAAAAAYERDRTRRRAYGLPGAFVDAAPVRERLERLYAVGYSVREVERISGVSRSEQYQITHRHWRTGEPVRSVRRETAEALDAVRGRSLKDCQMVDARPAVALVRRWMQAGLSASEVSHVSGVDVQVVRALNDGRRSYLQWRNLRPLVLAKDELDARCPRMPSDRPRKSKVVRATGRRVSEQEAATMRAERARGDTVAAIARRHGRSEGTVRARTMGVAVAP